LIVVALVAFVLPQALAWPLAAFALWLGASLLLRTLRVRKPDARPDA